jgi:hypothetical protein
MTTVDDRGRFGNRFIRNLAVHFLAKKYNLKVNYCDKELINRLGIELYSGTEEYANTLELTDNNYFDIYNCDNLNYNLNPNGLYPNGYFQTMEITNFLYNYLRRDEIMSNIIKTNPYKERYNNNNDIYIHVRLTDVEEKNPGITYYTNAIKNLTFDNIYISSDDLNHNIIMKLKELYPCSQLIELDEIFTMQLASTCKHIILSHGSFSAVIGYLSFYSNIYYPEHMWDKIWYGDMFSIKSDNWKQLSVK